MDLDVISDPRQHLACLDMSKNATRTMKTVSCVNDVLMSRSPPAVRFSLILSDIPTDLALTVLQLHIAALAECTLF